MRNTERQKFEEGWKSAFDGAEMTPPDRVWSSIELDLAGQESATMKKRVVFYQRLAAAFLLFSLGTGIYAFYPNDDVGTRGRGDEVTRDEVTKGRGEELKIAENSNEPVRETGQSSVANAQLATNNQQQLPTAATSQHTTHNTQPTTHNSQRTTHNAQPTTHTAEPEQPFIALGTTEPALAEEEAEREKEKDETVAIASPLLLEKPSSPEEIVEPKRKTSRESNLWLALGAAAGNYSPNTPSATVNPTADFAGPMLSHASAPQRKPEPKIGSSYSVGLAVGKKFGRVVVQTGVNLAKQQIDYSSNYDTRSSANSAKAASYDYVSTESSNSTLNFTTNTYTVNSTMEVVSIPVQAGYMIIDRKLGWQVNAGVSPDFFIRNILVDQSGQRERFTQSAGSDSPYRSVNWSGLLNTELSYRIGTHYRLSLVPGVRYSFHSILKEPTDNGRPLILDVGFRFRYLFD